MGRSPSGEEEERKRERERGLRRVWREQEESRRARQGGEWKVLEAERERSWEGTEGRRQSRVSKGTLFKPMWGVFVR